MIPIRGNPITRVSTRLPVNPVALFSTPRTTSLEPGCCTTMINKLAKVLRVVDLLGEYAGKTFSYLVLVIIALETIEVFRRYVLSSPTTWSWELSTLLYGAHFIIGGAWVLKEGMHVRTDIIYARLSPKTQALIDVILYLVTFFIFAGVLTWTTVSKAIYSWTIKETTYTLWAPPLYPLKMVIAISFILLLLQGLAQWLRSLIFLVKGEKI